ncbi:MAG: arginase family protein [archaeon]|jgi:arginase family enzyme
MPASKFCFFGVSTSEGALGKNSGCENAPNYLSELFSVQLNEFELTKNDVELQQKEIVLQSTEAFTKCIGKKVVFFGGTHDITFSTFKAFAGMNKDSSILIFDAHSDCDEGLSTPSHEDFVRALVEQKIVPPQNILLFGLRKIYPSEKEFLKTSGVKQIYFKDLEENKEKVFKEFNEFLINAKNLYLSFDVDVLDSNIMQATGYVHAGGLSVPLAKKYFSYGLEKATAIDLVEFNPKKIKLKEDKILKNIFNEFVVD